MTPDRAVRVRTPWSLRSGTLKSLRQSKPDPFPLGRLRANLVEFAAGQFDQQTVRLIGLTESRGRADDVPNGPTGHGTRR